ncbi:basic salivary proline-rich protein 4-like [Poecile atricapillus]|uniref:basic salivary proline-rich protein 4-like n=1 Tax=Poecile atricapillus TaxID=48891 RepID=UPI0027385C8F|nr:basic salivary proline-rich protein 4-like [Poecile atricapillus]
MDGDAESFSQFLLLTEQHRQLQELQQQLEQLRAAVAAAETPEETGGPPGDPEFEVQELREQERRGREELEELRTGLEALLAELEEGQGDPEPPQDPPGDPPGDPLWEQLRRLEMGVTRLLLRDPQTPVLAGNEAVWSRPPPPRPPSPREEPPAGEEEEEEGERPLSPGELRERVLREVLSREGPLPTPRLDLGVVPRPP